MLTFISEDVYVFANYNYLLSKLVNNFNVGHV